MAGFDRPWFVAGGWAIDLFLGSETRPHADIEIAILRHDQLRLQSYLTGWKFTKLIPGDILQSDKWVDGEHLSPPIHEIHALSPDDDHLEIEVLLNESRLDRWIFRRNTKITYPLSRIGGISREGIPFLSPEIVLLYKAKKPSPKDEADFYHTFKALDGDGRRWLSKAIKKEYPDHPWLVLL
jgi:hypothetical protein